MKRKPTYHIFKDVNKQWRWDLRSSNGKLIANGGEGYKNKKDCLKALNRVRNPDDSKIKIYEN